MSFADPVASAPSSLELSYVPQLKRSRITSFFRGLLAIPQYIALSFLGIVAGLAVIAGWAAALVSGRLPLGIRNFLGSYIRYTFRIYAYQWLLTDQYPPFSFHGSYPVDIDIPAPTNLNRLAVLFRLFLALPIAILAGAANLGQALIGIATWFSSWILGRVPKALYDIHLAASRFVIRYAAYVLLVVPTYPKGILGDEPAGDDSFLTQAGGGASAASEADQREHRVVLDKGTRILWIVSIAAGTLLYVLYVAVITPRLNSQASATTSARQLRRDYAQLNGQLNIAIAHVQTCQSAPKPLPCAKASSTMMLSAFATFDGHVKAIQFPAADSQKAAALDTQIATVISDLTAMSTANTIPAYSAAAARLQPDGSAFVQSYQALNASLPATPTKP